MSTDNSTQIPILEDLLDRARNGITGVANDSYRQASELFDMQEELVGALGQGSEQYMNLYAGVSDMQQNFYSMASEGGTALSTIFKDQTELIGEYQGIISSNLLQLHTSKDGPTTAREMADLTLYRRALGISSDEAGAFMERQFALTGEANDELLKQSLAYSNAIEEATGISSKIISKNITGMMSDVNTFGNMTVEEMSQAAAAIAQVGLEVTDVAGLVKKFSSFEGAADAVSKLTQVFGVQMDTMKYMTASFESPEDMLAMIQEDFEMAGVDMTNMNMAQKRLLSETLEMDISSVESLLGEAGRGLSQYSDTVSGSTSSVDRDDIENSLRNADNDISRINEMGDSLSEAQRILARKTSRAIGAHFSEGIKSVADESTRMTGTLVRLASQASTVYSTAIDERLGVTENFIEPLQARVAGGNQAALNAANAGEPYALAGNTAAWGNTTYTGVSEFASSVLDTLLPQSDTDSSTGTPGGGSAQEIPEVVSREIDNIHNDLIAAVSNDSAILDNISTLEISADSSSGQIEAILETLASTANGSITAEDMTRFTEAITDAMANSPNRPINITLTDTQEGFQARLDRANAITVSDR